MNQPIHVCLWFEHNAQEAAKFYCTIFKHSKIISSNPIATLFEVNEFRIMALNGNMNNAFNESASLVVSCETQSEIDHYWNMLTQGGQEQMCGWLKDKYGVSWQIVPIKLGEWLTNSAIAKDISTALLQMRKFDLAILEKIAANG